MKMFSGKGKKSKLYLYWCPKSVIRGGKTRVFRTLFLDTHKKILGKDKKGLYIGLMDTDKSKGVSNFWGFQIQKKRLMYLREPLVPGVPPKL